MQKSNIRFKNINYILLENTEKSIFGSIDKLIKRDSLYYIMDIRGTRQIICFNKKGEFIKKYGRIGRGPGEHPKITDFDVDHQGNVFIYSELIKKIVQYDVNNNSIKDFNVPFYARGVNLLNNNNFLFALTNSEETNRSVYCILDSESKQTGSFLDYSKNDETQRVISDYFIENNEKIISYVPTRSFFTVFDKTGQKIKTYNIDFDKFEAPDEFKFKAFDKNGEFKKNNGYAYLNKTPVFVNKNLFGEMVIGGGENGKINRFCFTSDTTEKTVYLEEVSPIVDYSHLGVFPYFATFNDTAIISFINYDLYEIDADKNQIPDYVSEHLQNGGFVLTLKSSVCVKKI